ncbi:hypothetical protein DFP94_102375 [Fontibacillus phaseoli]|uniref:Uncharacterized protein n=1 Tax=Fontibacillus phaseoli TaxID=1416533 RepID=A0A369BJ48_9BACL|nr:hypothetical protein [Fontibacillus phaseoli]RCX21620.1 hypothetical protein DFP94_102375 [Fontibacillus phaseoli]
MQQDMELEVKRAQRGDREAFIRLFRRLWKNYMKFQNKKSGGLTDEKRTGDLYKNFVLSPLGKNAKSITLKAFKPEYAEPGANKGTL